MLHVRIQDIEPDVTCESYKMCGSVLGGTSVHDVLQQPHTDTARSTCVSWRFTSKLVLGSLRKDGNSAQDVLKMDGIKAGSHCSDRLASMVSSEIVQDLSMQNMGSTCEKYRLIWHILLQKRDAQLINMDHRTWSVLARCAWISEFDILNELCLSVLDIDGIHQSVEPTMIPPPNNSSVVLVTLIRVQSVLWLEETAFKQLLNAKSCAKCVVPWLTET